LLAGAFIVFLTGVASMSEAIAPTQLGAQALAALETALTRLDLMDAMMISLVHSAAPEAREKAARNVLAAAELPNSTLITEDTAAAVNTANRRKIAQVWATALRNVA
jgi:hypothetical protein